MPQQRSRQSGYVLVFTVIVLGLFLSFAAVALDLGHIYLWQLKLDRSARAGVLSGLGYRSLKGWRTIYGTEPQYSAGGTPVAISAGQSAEMRKLLQVTHNVVLDNFRASFAPGNEPASNRESGEDSPMQHIYPMTNPTTGSSSRLPELPDDAYDPTTDTITVTYAYEVPTFFIGRISNILGFSLVCDHGNGTRCRVKTTQTASLDFATVILLLDVSGSMNCEVGDATCACRTLPGGCAEGDRIIDVLRPNPSAAGPFALQQFYQLFNPFRDRMAIIPFNMAAQVSFSTVDALGRPTPFGKDAATWTRFQDAITNLEAASNTNPCDGFIHAINDLQALYTALSTPATATLPQAPLDASNQLKPFVVLFSDGAPNAFRGSFQNLQNPGIINAGRPNDWYQFALEWISTPLPPNPATIWTGPSPLINAVGDSLFNYSPIVTGTLLSRPNNAPPPGTVPLTNYQCGQALWNGVKPLSPPGAIPFFGAALDWHQGGASPGCLWNGSAVPADPTLPNLLDFQLPGTVAGVSGVPLYPGRNRSGIEVLGTEELPYYCTVEAADYIRTTFGGSVFSIGLGNAGPSNCNDPLQDSGDSFTRKDNFLSRVAFDPSTSTPDGSGFLPQFSFSPRRTVSPVSNCSATMNGSTITVGYQPLTGVLTPSALNATANTAGRYYATNNPEDLPALFSQVAKQILLRLKS